MSGVNAEVRRLRQARPRNRHLEWSWRLLACMLLLPWITGSFGLFELLSDRRLANAKRFVGELVPYTLREQEVTFGSYLYWVWELLERRGFEALAVTLAISIAAILIAGLFGFLASFPASRVIVLDECLTRQSGSCLRCKLRLMFIWTARLFLMFLRAVPEYLWAFILLLVFGPSLWAAIFALAIHNSGIIGKLNSEFLDGLPRAPLLAMRDVGADRAEIALLGAVPLVLNRFLLFFFVRWETCVRESTVLGLLGIVSLGYWIEDARSRNHYDDMAHLVLFGALLVMFGDLLSTYIRSLIRRL